jgi:hypothetical protein
MPPRQNSVGLAFRPAMIAMETLHEVDPIGDSQSSLAEVWELEWRRNPCNCWNWDHSHRAGAFAGRGRLPWVSRRTPAIHTMCLKYLPASFVNQS